MLERLIKNVVVGTVGTFVTDKTKRIGCDTVIRTTKDIYRNTKKK